MSSFRQIEANRRNARKSTGPTTEAGKRRSRRNALRHGLAAETIIGALEDGADYRAFEATIIADYDAQTAVERELVLRLASVLWRLRRATTIETGLFDIQARDVREFDLTRQIDTDDRKMIYEIFGVTEDAAEMSEASGGVVNKRDPDLKDTFADTSLSRCFLRLANLASCPLDRVSRYEAKLWRQARQILFALGAIRGRMPARGWRR